MQIQFLNNSTYKPTFGARHFEPQKSVLSRPVLQNPVGDVVSFSTKNSTIPSFGSVAENSESSMRELSLGDFMAKMEKAYPNEHLSKAFRQIASDEKNFLGNGTVANVYSIPNVDDYVLRIAKVPQSRDSEIYSCDLKKSEDFSSKYNYGQPVAENYRGLFVLKKVTGAEHSFVNWNDIFHKMSTGSGMFTFEEVEAAFDKMQEIADFPLTSYVDFARKTEFLNHSNKKMDIINPNNLMVDPQKKIISAIDLWDDSFSYGHCYQGTDHMISLACDVFMNLEMVKWLPDFMMEDYVKATKTIINKCKKAGEIAGLNRSQDEVRGVYSKISEKIQREGGRNYDFGGKYDKFAEFYKDVL